MADVKWIKIATDIFDDEKILMIESLPSADSIIVIWFKLLTFAGKQNNHGVFIMNDRIAYTEEMLSTIFRRDLNMIRMALNTFEKYGMVEILDGTLTIPNWSKHQTLDKIEKRNEYQKKYMQEYRQKQRLLACKPNSSHNSSYNVSKLEEELEEELEEDKEIDSNIVPKGTSSAKAEPIDYQLISDTWNNLGLSKITKIVPNSTRQKMIKARIRESGFNNFIKAINNVLLSDFLNGKNDRGWIITFDWFIKPSNFIKVLEGNYSTNQSKQQYQPQGNKTKIEKFNAMESHEWDFDEIERLEREHIDRKLRGQENG